MTPTSGGPSRPEPPDRTNYLAALAFHLAIGDAPPPSPTMPDAAARDLRVALVREEAAEAAEALAALGGGGGLAAAARELADLLYVTYGTFVALGIDADEVFAEVHAANVRKSGAGRRSDGKQLKPDGWRPPDVAGVLERQARERRQGRRVAALGGSPEPGD